ncbi:serine/threonine protein kinase [Brevibacillus sp. SYSU BS000544]|uniref:serine/threonine protein kinase n=1 Tax=Brevibacillus sp. SYSU BS000544 TaxID=3416443 RepID=UPI003CE5B654
MSIQENDNFLQVGTVLHGSYRIEELTSSSELSHVYLCSHFGKEEHYIIKEFFPRLLAMRDLDNKTTLCRRPSMKAKFEQMKESFSKEALILKELSHPHIVQYFDHFQENGTSYIVMKYCKGSRLDHYVKEGINPDFYKKTVLPLIGALKYCHRKGVIHRDIKPSNVIINENGSPTLIDFGSAVSLRESKHKHIVTSNGYSPIEFYSEKSQQGSYSDLYSLAATLYYCMNGKPPIDVSERIIVDKLEHVRQDKKRVSFFFSQLIMWGLAISHKKRCPSITLFQIAGYLEHLFHRR